ncbi:MAG: 4-hydroxyproline epimerase [Hyphomicrobiales bacterium]|nr:4-hydroxyproline epimerase [Hyphomicrobiales bacterium]
MKHTFLCIDAHTCGNPVRVVAGGAPPLQGDTMSARREHFVTHFDWIRTGLMFEPRGHDMMSGAVLYPPLRDDVDASVVFIETSGCLPMCGHGAIGTITIAVEEGLVTPAREGLLRFEAPAGLVEAEYSRDDTGHVIEVRIRNVPSYVCATGLETDVPGLGRLSFDVAYGGNFYAIFEPQAGYEDLETLGVDEIRRLSRTVRSQINADHEFRHPEDERITGLRHIMWTGKPMDPQADGRNAVFYGDNAIDRSPCGTGTSARLAQLAARGALGVGDTFVNESIIGSLFHGRVEAETSVGSFDAIVPSVAGQAWITGYNTIFLDDRDPFVRGFSVT